eukprot:1888282-Amphidinium_carterae.2
MRADTWNYHASALSATRLVLQHADNVTNSARNPLAAARSFSSCSLRTCTCKVSCNIDTTVISISQTLIQCNWTSVQASLTATLRLLSPTVGCHTTCTTSHNNVTWSPPASPSA